MENKRFITVFSLFVLLLLGVGAFFTLAFILPNNPSSGSSEASSSEDSDSSSFVPFYFAILIPIIIARRKKNQQAPEPLTPKQRKVMMCLLISIIIMTLAVLGVLIMKWGEPVWPKIGITIALLVFGVAAVAVWKIMGVK